MSSAYVVPRSRLAIAIDIVAAIATTLIALAAGLLLWFLETFTLGSDVKPWSWDTVVPIMGAAALLTALGLVPLAFARGYLGRRRRFLGSDAVRVGICWFVLEAVLAGGAELRITVVAGLHQSATRHALTAATTIDGIPLERGTIVSETRLGTWVELPAGVRFQGGEVASFEIVRPEHGEMASVSLSLPGDTTILGTACRASATSYATFDSGPPSEIECTSAGQTAGHIACARNAEIARTAGGRVACTLAKPLRSEGVLWPVGTIIDTRTDTFGSRFKVDLAEHRPAFELAGTSLPAGTEIDWNSLGIEVSTLETIFGLHDAHSLLHVGHCNPDFITVSADPQMPGDCNGGFLDLGLGALTLDGKQYPSPAERGRSLKAS